MKLIYSFILFGVLAILAACGGGGGSAGTTSSSSSTTTTTTTTVTSSSPSISVVIQNSSGTTLSTNSIDSADTYYLVATVKNASGTVVANKLVTFSTSSSLATFVPSGGTALTDSSGVAKVKISPASTSSAGAGTVVAAATVDTVSVSASLDFLVVAGTVTTSNSTPSIGVVIQNSLGTIVSTNTINAADTYYLVATVAYANGTGVANKLVTFSTSSSLVTLVPSSGTVLTNSLGVAKVKIAPSSVSAIGAGTMAVAATVISTALSTSLDFQVLAGNVTLSNLTVSSAAISAFQSAAISVQAFVDGVAAAANALSVNFSASCGTVSPAIAAANSSGIAVTSYYATATCSGDVTISASASSANSAAATGVINVTTAKPANISFISATPALIVVSSNPLGVKQSTVKFQVLDASGGAMAGQSVNLSLAAAAISAGVTFQTTGTATQSATSDSSGYVTAIVQSGFLPTPVTVIAVLASNSAVSAASAGLAVTSGRPTQNAASLSATKLSIEAFNTDGVITAITFRVADRQGNPVPVNTPVTFVAEGGLVTGSCLLDTSSQCTVTLTSQGTRPADGRVTVLAYLDGEESFDDANGNNTYDIGETFYDMGEVYRDDNENGSYDDSTAKVYNSDGTYYKTNEELYPGGSTGSSSCASNGFSYPSVANTCDGIWSSNIRVRKQLVITFATADARIIKVSLSRYAGVFIITDNNSNSTLSTLTSSTASTRNSVATGSALTAALIVPPGVTTSCSVIGVSSTVIPNQDGAYTYKTTLNGDSSCSGLQLAITVTTPAGVATTEAFLIP